MHHCSSWKECCVDLLQHLFICIQAMWMGRFKVKHVGVPSFFILRGWFWIKHTENCFTLAFTFLFTKQNVNLCWVNPLNAELNPICNLLVLLGDLTFMGKCIVSISKKMQRYTVYLYLETALHVSGGTTTHHQEHKQLYLQHLLFVTPLLLPAASGR
jgi:hypothetical protein